MTKILFNPDQGAIISDVTFEGTRYFSDKTFEPGSLFKFEDDNTADFFIETFAFLELISLDKAKELLKTPPLKCDKCEFLTRNIKSLATHNKKHVAEAQLDELGIPTVRMTNRRKEAAAETNNDVQTQIESQENNFRDGFPGLEEGEGLTSEHVNRGAVMT